MFQPFGGTMEAVIGYFQENWKICVIIALCGIPFVFLTRKFTVPLLQWLVELLIYFGIFHTIVHYVVIVAVWFNFNSQMKMLEKEKVRLEWTTPLFVPWRYELYNPQWLLYLEVAMFVVLIGAMLRYRPMKTQKLLPKRETLRKGSAPSVRPPMAGAPGRGR
jgi:hypothetical protein